MKSLHVHLRNSILLGIILLLGTLGSQKVAAQTPGELANFEAMRFRLIGPFRGGRVTAVTGIPQQPHTFLMGSTGGGIWRTDDGGTTWRNISDGFFTSASMGALAVAPSDPQVIYAGTGSACPRGNISLGDGVYRSTDGGDTWQHSGLPHAGLIGKIEVHPDNPDLLYVAALGNIFGPNPERGVYRSRDGGNSWEQVFFLNDSTGCVDLALDPSNPRILYAGFWRAERKPWTLIDGGPEGGLYKSTDGGDSWEKVQGLPEGIGGRIGVTVSPANPKRIWVIREMQKESDGGVFRSDDGGKSWKKVNREHKLRQRAWYYNHILADPQDEHTVYVMNTGFYRSVDGGESFTRIPTPHGDNHGLWINPTDPQIMVQCNDGGANVSYNGGKSWSTQNNQPTAEFYRVAVDEQFPYRVYGAQQDNSTISVPSNSPGGLTPLQHWYAVGGGESGHIAVDPRNPSIVYAGNYIGTISRVDLEKGHARNVVAYPQMHDGVAPRDIQYRFQWNAPIRLSPHNPDILYHCSQYVHKSTNGGQSWEVISPDLSTNKDAYHDIPGGPIQHDHTGVELYTTIFAFEESPHQAGELWAGTDDGRLHLSRNGGETWEEITPKNLPAEGTINMIEHSPHQPGRAFIAVYKYRENDFRPYIFRTDNYGKKWVLLTDGENGIPVGHFTRVVREDPVRKGLLYAGTEYGMYLSLDDGRQWQPFQLNLPVTPVTDMLIHRNDLVVATQGRSFWVMDDLSPLQHLTPAQIKSQAFLIPPRKAYRTQLRGFRGDDAPESAPSGALLSFWLHTYEKMDTVKMEIRQRSGEVVKVFSTHPQEALDEETLKVQPGLNRFNWDLRTLAPKVEPGSYFSLAYTGGTYAPPGTYEVTLQTSGQTLSQTLEIGIDPRWEVSAEDLQAQYLLAQEVKSELNRCHAAIGQLRDVRDQVNQLARTAVKGGYAPQLKQQATEISDLLTSIEIQLIQTQNESGQDPINYPPMLDDQIAYLYSTVHGQDARPTQGCYDRLKDVQALLNPLLQQLEDVLNTEVKAFEDKLEASGVPRVVR